METKKYHRMGRPPAKWLVRMKDISFENDAFVNVYQISEELGVNVKTLASFCYKYNLKSKYDLVDGKLSRLFKVKDLKKTAKEHLESWK